MKTKFPTSLLAALTFALGLGALAPVAHAGLFADFIEPGSGPSFPNDFKFTNTHSPSHATYNSVGSVMVRFRYDGVAGLPGGYQNAKMTMASSILGTDHATNSGASLHQDTEAIHNGTISFKLLAPATEGGHTGTNLLSITFSQAFLVGTDQGSSVDLDSQIGGPQVVFTSDFITNFSPADESFALHFLLGNHAKLTIDTVNHLFTTFLASGKGDFFDTLAPEPTSIALMLLGLVLTIMVARKPTIGSEATIA